jgi:aminopeptidase-like protein
MKADVFRKSLDRDGIGSAMMRLIERLYPICRSITGDGLRETLAILQAEIPIKIHEVASGTKVFDWTVPKEWTIRDAFIKNAAGERVIDFRKSNLHVVGYSMPVARRMPLTELKAHLFSLPEHPHWIPYRTSYYREDWGFCLTHRQLLALIDDAYEVVIDSSLKDGHLSYGECILPGRTEAEVLISCHVCHPSLCNDNLSGIALSIQLAKELQKRALRYSYRFLFIPGTIGSITWLALNEETACRIQHGLVVAGVGDAGKITYKRSRRGNAEIDQAVVRVLQESGEPFDVIDFFPYGYDERQYGSPGFNLPVGCLMRTPFGRYPEYHTSGDNLTFVRQESLEDSFSACLKAMWLLEGNRKYVNTNPKCEPHLGRRGLYNAIGGRNENSVDQLAVLWVLNLSDGRHSLLDISERSQIEFGVIQEAADALVRHQLLVECLPPEVT